MSLDTTDQVFAIGASVAAILAVLAGLWFRWLRPKWTAFVSKFDAGFESLVGRPAMVDPGSGREVSPAVPGIGVRMADLEDAVKSLAINSVRLDDHEHRLGKLEEAYLERVVSRAESAQAWSAMQAVADSTPPTLEDPS